MTSSFSVLFPQASCVYRDLASYFTAKRRVIRRELSKLLTLHLPHLPVFMPKYCVFSLIPWHVIQDRCVPSLPPCLLFKDISPALSPFLPVTFIFLSLLDYFHQHTNPPKKSLLMSSLPPAFAPSLLFPFVIELRGFTLQEFGFLHSTEAALVKIPISIALLSQGASAQSCYLTSQQMWHQCLLEVLFFTCLAGCHTLLI